MITIINERESAAEKCNRLHEKLTGMARMSLATAIEIGGILAEQKARLKHGEWLPWCREKLNFDVRTGQKYVKLFERKNELGSHLGVNEAYRLLSQPAETEEEPELDFSEPSPEGEEWQEMTPPESEPHDPAIAAKREKARADLKALEEEVMERSLEYEAGKWIDEVDRANKHFWDHLCRVMTRAVSEGKADASRLKAIKRHMDREAASLWKVLNID